MFRNVIYFVEDCNSSVRPKIAAKKCHALSVSLVTILKVLLTMNI